jgi:VCBS repeat-containing protein
LANDSDVDGDVLSAVLVSTAQHGTLSLAANGSFTYTPTANFNGTDSFTYRANDGTVDSAPVTVTITVAAVAVPPPTSHPAGYVPVTPERLLDTRAGVGTRAGIVPADGVVELTVTGVGATNVPADASAVVLNVTATEAQAPGFVTVWPCGQPRPNASNLNTTPGLNTPNSVTAKIGTGGKVCLYTLTPTHLIADINGWHPTNT